VRFQAPLGKKFSERNVDDALAELAERKERTCTSSPSNAGVEPPGREDPISNAALYRDLAVSARVAGREKPHDCAPALARVDAARLDASSE
jgi:hypothetical protein